MQPLSQGNALVPIVLLGWAFFIPLLFLALPHRRAVIVAFVFAWMFLPMAKLELPGFPDYNKVSATCAGIFLATLFFELNRFIRFRPGWLDLPIAILCICPLASSLSNGLGLYNGLSSAFLRTIMWGMPYFIGRVYFNDLRGLRELAIGMFIGGLVYIPFCLYEIRMSPQLHHIVYGYHQHSFAQTSRYGGWRPMVFMQHGLMVGMWMASASLVGLWLRLSTGLKHIAGVPTIPLLLVLFGTTFLCKSIGALIILAMGLAILLVLRWRPTPLPFFALSAVIVIYLAVRASGLWSGEELVTTADTILGAQRAGSLQTRLVNEEILSAHARQRPVLGWGNWGRNRPTGMFTIPDSLWIIFFGSNGVVGLCAVVAVLLLPALFFIKRLPLQLYNSSNWAPAVCFAALLILYMVDNLFNYMYNPLFLLVSGGLMGLKPLPYGKKGM